MLNMFDADLLPDLLPLYYSKCFPTNQFCRWITAGCSPSPLSHRELSFTLAEDVYVRYLTINNQKELQTMLQKKCPYKIDIGGVYKLKPTIGNNANTVLSRELVFDIDMTDYDEIRTCCQGASVCKKCWKFMVIACQVLDAALKEDFGFTGVLWVFSGRRGVHCWVSSAEAKNLSSSGRGAVADYLALVTGGESQAKKVNISGDSMHSSIKRALKIVTSHFDTILEEQQFISSAEGLASFVKMIPNETLASNVLKGLQNLAPDSSLRWKTFLQLYQSHRHEHNHGRKLKYLVEEIQLQWCYPRLDINVTKGTNHLLKAPFSIHPKTGKVCVTFKASQVESFDLDAVPTIAQLLDDQMPNYEKGKSRMQEAVKCFQDHVFLLEKEEAKRRRNTAEDTLEF